MLQDPINDVLNPLTLNEVDRLDCQGIVVENAVHSADFTWKDCDSVQFSNGKSTLPLRDFLTLLPAEVPAEASYDLAYGLAMDQDYKGAAAQFLKVALEGHNVAAALYGFASAIAQHGKNARSEKLAQFVAETDGFTDPRAYALAGYCAFSRKAAKPARVHLAKAARLARASQDYRPIQKFAQRVLLIQQFGSGEID